MKKYRPDALRNIGIIAHIDAGKTTLTERLLYYAHKIHKTGEVHDGNATMDYLEEEQKRGITISSACTTIQWNGAEISIIDTPGHVDFNVEVERALRVCDGAVVVLCGISGIESQSETVWRQAQKYGLPKLAFVNKIDRPGADFWRVTRELGQRFGITALAMTMPSATEGRLIDWMRGQAMTFAPDDHGSTITLHDLDPDEAALCAQARRDALEALADFDDELMELYLADAEIPEACIVRAIRTGTLAGTVVPVFCGSALKNFGVQPVMDGIVHFLPNPEHSHSHKHVQSLIAEHGIQADGFVGFVFKVQFDGAHKRNFIRVYNGQVSENSAVYNSRRKAFEKIHKLYAVHANKHESITQARPGEIVLATGLKECVTADTLFHGKTDLLLEHIDILQPVLNIALVPGSASDTEKLELLLERYVIEDPTLRFFTDADTEQLIVSGLGELHLEVLLERLRRESGVAFRYGNPQVIFLETIQAQASAESSYKKTFGEHIHRALVRVAVSPRERGQGNVCVADCGPGPYTEIALKAMEDALQAGVVQGCVVADVQAQLIAIEPFENSLTDLGVRMATLDAMKEALTQARPTIMEPLMDMRLGMPPDYVGECVNLLGAKNARILDVRTGEHDCGIVALAPMRQLFGFATELRSRTKGKAFYTLTFERYDVVE